MKQKFSVLFADDESSARLTMSMLLNTIFSTVYLAKDGLEAFNIYNEKQPDVLILDNLMPNITGLEVVKKIRKIDSTTKIIMLTAYKDEEYLLDAIKLLLTDYIVKPLKPFDFLNLLKETIKELSVKNKIYFQDVFMFDKNNDILYKNNEIINLTKTEAKLLFILISKLDQDAPLELIANYIWDNKELSNYSNSLRNYINKIHKKIDTEIISSVYGYGYKIKK